MLECVACALKAQLRLLPLFFPFLFVILPPSLASESDTFTLDTVMAGAMILYCVPFSVDLMVALFQSPLVYVDTVMVIPANIVRVVFVMSLFVVNAAVLEIAIAVTDAIETLSSSVIDPVMFQMDVSSFVAIFP